MEEGNWYVVKIIIDDTKNFHISSQIDFEQALVGRLKTCPKVSSHIRNQRTGASSCWAAEDWRRQSN